MHLIKSNCTVEILHELQKRNGLPTGWRQPHFEQEIENLVQEAASGGASLTRVGATMHSVDQKQADGDAEPTPPNFFPLGFPPFSDHLDLPLFAG